MTSKLCSFNECSKPSRARGLCAAHYAQLTAGKKLTKLKTRRLKSDVLSRDGNGNKRCEWCFEWLPVVDFKVEPTKSDKLNPVCVDCTSIKERLRKYNLTYEQLLNMMTRQDYGCGICDTPLFPDAHIDHDHNCCNRERSCGKCVRGILCKTCNTALGSFKEDPSILRSAINYLEGSK